MYKSSKQTMNTLSKSNLSETVYGEKISKMELNRSSFKELSCTEFVLNSNYCAPEPYTILPLSFSVDYPLDSIHLLVVQIDEYLRKTLLDTLGKSILFEIYKPTNEPIWYILLKNTKMYDIPLLQINMYSKKNRNGFIVEFQKSGSDTFIVNQIFQNIKSWMQENQV